MLKYRLISFCSLLGLVYVIFACPVVGGYAFVLTASALIGMTLFEAGAVFKKLNFEVLPRFSGICGAVMTFFWLLFQLYGGFHTDSGKLFAYCFAVLVLGLFSAFWITMLCRNRTWWTCVLNSIALLAVIGAPLILTASSYFFNYPNSTMPLLFLILATKATDTGGYIFGTLTAKLPRGNHKIAPSISPKKSWEGLIGGILLSLAVGFLLYRYNPVAGNYQQYKTLQWHVISACILSLGCFFGDLTESALKRQAGIKDSGHWLPGMGGALDLVDSFIFNGLLFPVLYYVF